MLAIATVQITTLALHDIKPPFIGQDMDQLRLLVIEDSLTIRALIEEIVDQEPGCKIVGFAGDIPTARQKMADLAPNLVTLDLALPGQTGLEFLAELNGQKRPPIVVVSSSTKSGSAALQEAFSSGADACFDKSKLIADRPTFVGILHEVVKSRRLQSYVATACDSEAAPISPSDLVGAVNFNRIIAEHEQIGNAIDGLAALADAEQVDEFAAKHAIKDLAAVMADHVDHEDSLIYSRIALQQTDGCADDAKELMEHFVKLCADWSDYATAWSGSGIEDDPLMFREHTRSMTHRLKQRVLQENVMLYSYATAHGHSCPTDYV